MGSVGARQVGLGVIEANRLRSDLPRPYFWRGYDFFLFLICVFLPIRGSYDISRRNHHTHCITELFQPIQSVIDDFRVERYGLGDHL